MFRRLWQPDRPQAAVTAASKQIQPRRQIPLTSVALRPDESQEKLLKRFRKQVQRERILSDVRKKRFFLSKSEKRRIALQKAKRRERRRQRKKQRAMRWYN
jgi:small subunit ribosomal protein S21